MIPRTHRADLDGLRAVAVALVVLFHASSRCPGGFIGVDVFFVISGFLITGLLLGEQERGGIRVATFWLRRVRRLLPAVAVMVLATLATGFVLLLPGDYRELAESAIAQQLLLSNVFFAVRTGYFQGDADLKPLLHTWSLAVEEQFYVAYPLLIMLLGRLSRRLAIAVLLVLAGCSFAVSDAGARGHAPAAFYLLPSRAWEILLGGLVWVAPLPRRRTAWVANLLAASGLAGILLAAWAFESLTPFPGRAALLPCAAAALLIYANTLTTTWVGRLLAARPVVFVGLISYSLYLWHWPILCFVRHAWCGGPPGKIAKAVALSVSLVVAMLSWRYVEQPFRSAELLPRPRDLCRAAAVAAALLLAAAAAIVLGDGLPWRLSPQAAAYARSAGGSGKDEQGVTVEDVRSGKLPTCGAVDGPATCLLWGDSHAMALIPGLEAASRETGFRCLPVTMPATAPVLDFFVRYPAGLNERSADWARAAVDHAKAEGVDVVFLAAHWEWYAPAPTFATRLDATVRELAAAGVHVVIVRDVARFPSSVPLTLCMATRLGTDVTTIGVPIGEHARRNERCDALFSRLEGGGVAVLDLAPAFVDRAGLWRAEYDGVAMYRDSNHLSQAGSLRTRTLFESVLRRFAAGR